MVARGARYSARPLDGLAKEVFAPRRGAGNLPPPLPGWPFLSHFSTRGYAGYREPLATLRQPLRGAKNDLPRFWMRSALWSEDPN